MDMTSRQRETEMNPLEIERALNELWREHADEVRQGTPMPARARLANLVTFCRSRDEADRAFEVVATLNVSRPVRSILVLAEQAPGTARSTAGFRCGTEGGRMICYEEVVLHTPGETGDALPSLIEPLTVTDLPTFLWFPGDPPLEDAQVRRLLPFVDRVVVDSHEFTEPMARFRQLHALVEELRGQVVITGMTWTRLGTWREAIGKLFDPDASREFLPKISEVTITSVPGLGVPSDRALLMAGWLASKLAWRPVRLERGGATRAHYEAADGPVTLTFEEAPAAARGHLLGVALHAGEVTFRVNRRREDSSGAIQSSIICSGEEAPGPAYRPLHYTPSELLCNAMEIRSPFTDWEEALASVAALEG